MIEECIIDKLESWARGREEAPHKVHLYPTNRCNLRCPFCYQQLSPYDYSDVMSREKWVDIIRELGEMGTDVIRISGGGEPLLVKNKTLPMMEEVKKHDVTGRMTTNGTLFDEKSIEKVVEMGWDHMVFSVDGPDAETHDFHRGVKGTFAKVTENIRKFNKVKKRHGKKQDDAPLLEFSSVLSTKNWKKVPETIRLASELGVKVVTFEPLFVSNPMVKKLKLSEEERKEFVKVAGKWKELAEDFGVYTNIDTVIDVGKVENTGNLKEEILSRSENERKRENGESVSNNFLDLPCYEPWLWPKIEANGDVGPCSTNLLDVNIKEKTFREVWLGEQFNEFRQLIKNRNLPSGCENCVSTHIPIQEKIRNKLERRIEENG